MNIRDDQLYRISDIFPKEKDRPKLLPMSRSTFWSKVKEGQIPKPTKFGPRISAWKGQDIRQIRENGLEG